jgi:CheY-like chemotaxis protein
MKATDTAVILVVDNDPTVRGYLEHIIKDAGHVCVTASTGAQALAEWQERSFDLVVTDLNMPNGDGIALAKSLQRSEAVPIIFITGFAGDHAKGIGEVKDASVLEKPFDSDDLLRLIDARLGGRPIGEDGRNSLDDGRRQWHGGIAHAFRGGAWREGYSEPVEEDAGMADEDNPGLK